MTKLGHNNKSHSVAHSQSHSHHGSSKAVTHRSPVLAKATAATQHKLLHQQTKSKNAAVKTFKSPNSSDVSVITLGGNSAGKNKSSGGLSLCGVSGALAGLIPPNQSQPMPLTSSLPSVASMSSVLDRFKAASTPTHTKKSVREQVVEKIQTVLMKYPGKLGVHVLIGFNSIQRLMENSPRQISMIVIAKDCKAEFLHILIKSAIQQRVPYLILPSFSNMLREACQVKSAFCFAIRSETGLQNAMKDYREKSEKWKVEKMSKKSKQKTTESLTETTGDEDNAEVGMDLDEDVGKANEKKQKKQAGEEILEAEALEAAVDDLREYLATLIAAENNQ